MESRREELNWKAKQSKAKEVLPNMVLPWKHPFIIIELINCFQSQVNQYSVLYLFGGLFPIIDADNSMQIILFCGNLILVNIEQLNVDIRRRKWKRFQVDSLNHIQHGSLGKGLLWIASYTNTFCKLDKYILKFRQTHFEISTNTFCRRKWTRLEVDSLNHIRHVSPGSR